MKHRSRKDRIKHGALDPADLHVKGMQDVDLLADVPEQDFSETTNNQEDTTTPQHLGEVGLKGSEG